jgi:acyl carrier protein
MALNISLNGSNYVSEKTRSAFEQALEEAGGKGQESRIEQPTTHNPQPATHTSQLLTLNSQLAMLDRALAQSYEHQTLTMRVHEQYLNNQGDYARLFGQLMQQQGTIFAQGASAPQQAELATTVLETLARSMARFHDLQEQTLDVHKQFLAQQSDYARATIQLLAEQTGGSKVESQKLQVESQPLQVGRTPKQGNGNGHYPQEAGSKRQDTGIENPQLSVLSPQSSVPSPQSPNLQSSISQSPPLPLSSSLIPSLLAIVSEKTGYPTDMLELDMDMEADLGIDSIKRVEILGALQDAHPDLPEVSTDVLAEMRTLRQIVEKMQEVGNSKLDPISSIQHPVSSIEQPKKA